MGGVRLRYATLANFIAVTIRILVSIGFIVIVARRLPPEDFAVLGIILSLYNGLPQPSGIWNWWTQRYVGLGLAGRDGDPGVAQGTGLIISIVYSITAFILYIIIIYVTLGLAGLDVYPALLASPAIIFVILARHFMSVVSVARPELVGVANLLHEAGKLGASLVLVLYMGLGVAGASESLIVASMLMLLFLAYHTWRLGLLTIRRDLRLAWSWIRGAFIPGLIALTDFTRNLIRPAYTWVTRLGTPIAYINIALSVASAVNNATQSMIPALYAKVLRGGDRRDLEESLRLYMLIFMYMMGVAAALSRPITSMFNPLYLDGSFMVVLGALFSLSLGFLVQFRGFLLAYLRVEEPGSDRVKVTRLLLMELVFIGAGIIAGGLLSRDASSPAEAAIIYMMVIVATQLAGSLVYVIQIPGGFRFPWRVFMETLVSFMVVVVYLDVSGARGVLVYDFFGDAPLLAFHVAVSGIIYSGVMYLVSPWFRGLARSGFRYISGRLG
ncbi:MAG: hypothetical protein GSR86_05345 [Desulfurococcales archaeon]|nr:hypothetical protein [Desulfurococcales archaeon]